MPPQIYSSPHIVDIFDADQKFSDLIKLAIIWVINEAAAIDSVFWMKKI
jgi:hypothetical protein